MNTDPIILAFALAMHKEAQERARHPRAVKEARTARRAIRPATVRGPWRRPRRAPRGAEAGGTA
jgi:hypothetical protein